MQSAEGKSRCLRCERERVAEIRVRSCRKRNAGEQHCHPAQHAGFHRLRYVRSQGIRDRLAAVISNRADIASHRGKVRHSKKADLFLVMLWWHEPNNDRYFFHFSSYRITISSFSNKGTRKRVEVWAGSVPMPG